MVKFLKCIRLLGNQQKRFKGGLFFIQMAGFNSVLLTFVLLGWFSPSITKDPLCDGMCVQDRSYCHDITNFKISKLCCVRMA